MASYNPAKSSPSRSPRASTNHSRANIRSAKPSGILFTVPSWVACAATAAFLRAIELEPHYLNHHLELGRTYLQLKRRDEARRELERVLALPPTSNPRDPHFQQQARELLGRLPGQD